MARKLVLFSFTHEKAGVFRVHTYLIGVFLCFSCVTMFLCGHELRVLLPEKQ